MYLKALTSVLLAIALNAFATEPSSQVDENADPSGPRFISPDGRYGLLVTKDPEGESDKDRVELIELATKRSLLLLSDPEQNELTWKARLDWSADSKRLAAYTGGRVDGSVRIFVREGDGFVEVKLPDFPDLPDLEEPSAAFRKKHNFKFLKWINAGSLKFVRWLDSGDVELQSYNEAATVGGGVFRAQISATVAIDSKHHATLKKVVREEKFE